MPSIDLPIKRLVQRRAGDWVRFLTYRVVRVWEEPRQSVIERGLIGLYPLLPLMKGEKNNCAAGSGVRLNYPCGAEPNSSWNPYMIRGI
ncbi:hypothetical protein MORE_26170 [Moorella thermoacetica]|nr:hypothetical protein MORE_26170 [Moorella thermoacetica]